MTAAPALACFGRFSGSCLSFFVRNRECCCSLFVFCFVSVSCFTFQGGQEESEAQGIVYYS